MNIRWCILSPLATQSAVAHIAPSARFRVCGRDMGPDGASGRITDSGLELCDLSRWPAPINCGDPQGWSVLPRGEPGGVSDAKGWGGIPRWPGDLLLPR